MMDTLQRCVMDVSESTQLASKSSSRNTFDLLLTNGIKGVKTLRKTFSKKPLSGPSSRNLKTGALADTVPCCSATAGCDCLRTVLQAEPCHCQQWMLLLAPCSMIWFVVA